MVKLRCLSLLLVPMSFTFCGLFQLVALKINLSGLIFVVAEVLLLTLKLTVTSELGNSFKVTE